jgi:hypothetical protein
MFQKNYSLHSVSIVTFLLTTFFSWHFYKRPIEKRCYIVVSITGYTLNYVKK